MDPLNPASERPLTGLEQAAQAIEWAHEARALQLAHICR